MGGASGEVPHDLAHLIVEQELGLRQGVWGVLVAGGMFRHAKVVAGRRAPHATSRGHAAIAEAGDRIMQAEVLTRAVCDACVGEVALEPAAIRRRTGDRWWADSVTVDALHRSRDRLRDAGERWVKLAPGASLEELWMLWAVASARHGPASPLRVTGSASS